MYTNKTVIENYTIEDIVRFSNTPHLFRYVPQKDIYNSLANIILESMMTVSDSQIFIRLDHGIGSIYFNKDKEFIETSLYKCYY